MGNLVPVSLPYTVATFCEKRLKSDSGGLEGEPVAAKQFSHGAFAHAGETAEGGEIGVKAALGGVAPGLPVLAYKGRLPSGVESIGLREMAQGDNPLLALKSPGCASDGQEALCETGYGSTLCVVMQLLRALDDDAQGGQVVAVWRPQCRP